MNNVFNHVVIRLAVRAVSYPGYWRGPVRLEVKYIITRCQFLLWRWCGFFIWGGGDLNTELTKRIATLGGKNM